jgi:hypothetical protein
MCGTEGESGVIMATCGMGEVVRAIGRVGELLGGRSASQPMQHMWSDCLVVWSDR